MSFRALLSQVARSFDLSLRLLPPLTRETIALTYLLARAADTIADTVALPPARRMEALAELRAALGSDDEELRARFEISEQAKPHERELVKRIPEILQLWRGLRDSRRERSKAVLEKLTGGMLEDLERFPAEDSGEIAALASLDELITYTDSVAGCVGPFWTAVHGDEYFELDYWANDERTLQRAQEFGRGLQLINILRDLASDLAMGRCYIPLELLNPLGLSPRDLKSGFGRERLAEPLERLRQLAGLQINVGWAYTSSIPWGHWRLRLASAMPLLIGAETLALLRSRDPFSTKPAKISKLRVFSLLLGATFRIPSRRLASRWFSGVAARAGIDERPLLKGQEAGSLARIALRAEALL
jgi:farnesyl-diphosphate farnesyltransferase